MNMPEYERAAREAVAKALKRRGWDCAPESIRIGTEASDSMQGIMIRALLPLLSTSELERRALEACEAYADMHPRMRSYEVAAPVAAVLDVGRESLAAKKPKGPWRVVEHAPNRAAHNDGRECGFWKPHDPSAPNSTKICDFATCAAFVAEQNEREAAR